MDTLPNEILVEVFMYCPDARTALALSSTSRRFRAIYTESEQSMLSFICWNQIHPAVLPVAVDTYKMRQSFVPGDRASALTFLSTFPNSSLDDSTEFALEKSKALLQFHHTIEYFIHDYVHTWCAMIETCARENEAILSPLSTTEYVRLARAFYRFELYEIIFREPMGAGLKIPAIDQCDCFLRRLKDWELGELLCVRKYLITKFHVLWNQLEDYALSELLVNWPDFDTPTGINSPFEDQWLLFSNDWRGDGRLGLIDGFFWYGLSKIRGILRTSEEEEFSNLFETFTCRDAKLPKALKLIPAPTRGPRRWEFVGQVDVFPLQKDSVHPISFKESYTTSNAGWTWSYYHRGRPDYSSDSYFKKDDSWLLQWGYCIWDYSRLRSLDFFTKSTWELEKQYKSSELGFRPTVEERWHTAKEKYTKDLEESSQEAPTTSRDAGM